MIRSGLCSLELLPQPGQLLGKRRIGIGDELDLLEELLIVVVFYFLLEFGF